MRTPLVPWLQIYRQLVQSEIKELRSYAHALEDALEDEKQRLQKQSEEQASKMTEEERMDFYEWVSDDFYRLGETFPKILRYSLFVHTYSLLENTLLRIAEHLHVSQKLELSPSDLRDEGIVRAKTYLKKVARVSFPDGGVDWQDILALNHIRNIVVHKAGYFPEDHSKRQQIDALLTKWSGEISLDNIRQFTFSGPFIERVIETCKNFLDEVFTNIKDTTP